MKLRSLSIALISLHLPYLTAAQCSVCNSYSAALKSCQTTSANVTAVGGTMDTTSVHCMCISKSSTAQMNTCQGCDDSNTSLNLDISLLYAWYLTCKADEQWGDQQGVACWEGQPDNFLPCVEKTGGKGSDAIPGGSEVTSPATSPSAAATSSTKAKSTAPTPSPSAKAKSEAEMSHKALGISSIMFIGLAVVLGL